MSVSLAALRNVGRWPTMSGHVGGCFAQAGGLERRLYKRARVLARLCVGGGGGFGAGFVVELGERAQRSRDSPADTDGCLELVRIN